MNEKLSDVSDYEKDLEKLKKRVKALFNMLGYFGSYSNWLDEQENGSKHAYSASRKFSSTEIEMMERELIDLNKDAAILNELISKGHNYIFIGKAGSFCPVKSGQGGGILVREKDGKYYAATGSKGFRWREGESISGSNRIDLIDMGYFENLANTAKKSIEEYGPFEDFSNEEQKKKQISIDEVLSNSDRMFETNKNDLRDPPWN